MKKLLLIFIFLASCQNTGLKDYQYLRDYQNVINSCVEELNIGKNIKAYKDKTTGLFTFDEESLKGRLHEFIVCENKKEHIAFLKEGKKGYGGSTDLMLKIHKMEEELAKRFDNGEITREEVARLYLINSDKIRSNFDFHAPSQNVFVTEQDKKEEPEIPPEPREGRIIFKD